MLMCISGRHSKTLRRCNYLGYQAVNLIRYNLFPNAWASAKTERNGSMCFQYFMFWSAITAEPSFWSELWRVSEVFWVTTGRVKWRQRQPPLWDFVASNCCICFKKTTDKGCNRIKSECFSKSSANQRRLKISKIISDIFSETRLEVNFLRNLV